MLVKKLFGNDLVGRSVKYLIKCPYYLEHRTQSTQNTHNLLNALAKWLNRIVGIVSCFDLIFEFDIVSRQCC